MAKDPKIMSLTNDKKGKGTFTKEDVKESPFTIVKQGKVVRIVAGQYLVSNKEFASIKAAREYVESKPYELILNTAAIMASKVMEDMLKAKEDKGNESKDNSNS